MPTMRLAVLALALAGAALPANAQFEAFSAHAQARDVAVDASRGVLFIAIYDRNEVWEVDAATSETLAKAPVGQGPVAVALSENQSTLACVSHLANTVTLIRVEDMAPYATVEYGKGACDVAALKDGRFAVTNSFSDSVTLIDPDDPERPTAIAAGLSVPSGVAASRDYCVVSTRVPPLIHIFSTGPFESAGTVRLDDPPRSVAALNNDCFAVATTGGIVLIDARQCSIIAKSSKTVKSIATDGDRLFALTDEAVEIMDPSLETFERVALAGPGSAVSGVGDFLVVVSPRDKQWQTCGALPAPVVKPQRRAPVEVETTSGVPVIEAQPVVESEPSPAPPEELEPVKETLQPPPEPADQAEPVEVSEMEPRPRQEPAPKEAPGKKAAETSDSRFRHLPMVGPEPTAPRPARRPNALLMAGPSRPSLQDALTGKLTLSRANSFEPPDWTQPLRDVQTDHFVEDMEKGERTLEGNVRLRLEDTTFSADHFWQNLNSGEMRAQGNVVVVQEPSVLLADEVCYYVPEESELPEPRLFATAMDEQERARLRLKSGLVDATNAAILQPNQELRVGRLRYDMLRQTGELDDARAQTIIQSPGRTDVYYFGARKLHIAGPGSFDGEDVWLTTCDHDPPHYKIHLKRAMVRDGQVVYGQGARFYLGKHKTPIYWPRWGSVKGKPGRSIGFDFDSGHRAGAGYYVNVGQQFAINRDVRLGLRFYPTSHEGVGFGIEGEYDYTKTPASPLFLGKGSFRTLYTTKDRGYYELYHRHEPYDDTVLLVQAEQWYDRDFLKDFYYEEYRHRSTPRNFANITHTKPTYIATGTLRVDTHDFVRETERMPEATYHVLERRLAENLYVSYDAVVGYNEREPTGVHATRMVNVGRLTYDWDLDEALTLTPFMELDATFYSHERDSDASAFRLADTIGTTLQTRFHRTYPGRRGFSGFKHVVVPSITYSYRPEPTIGVEETPRFDAYDVAHGRSRIETKLDNIVFGRDAETEEVWQVARLTLYQGNDFWNEIQKAKDYELEMDLRPRPWWGWEFAAEHHSIDDEFDLEKPFLVQRTLLEAYERVFGRPYDEEIAYQYSAQFGDYTRMLTYLYYDDEPLDGNFNARVGYAYTRTHDLTYNREIIYGMGYQLGEHWGVAFEHRYDFERDELHQQKYQLRRSLHCWETAITFRDRPSGWDVGFELSIAAFPATRLKF